MDVARELARQYLAMKRRKGAAARSAEEQAAIEQNIVQESMNRLADAPEGPEHVCAREI